ncbi:hypothetical protein BJX76DRAFT_355002 [Aspergillus varians]
MDLLKQRLTFACMYAFEEIGIQELEEELLRQVPQANCHCEYSRLEDVLVIKGKLEGYIAPITAAISFFIENQKHKDLLDSPRLRVLDLPSVVRDDSSVMDNAESGENGGLLALDDDSAKIIPHRLTQVTKFWLSSAGGIGCFAANKYYEMLNEVAKNTGTEIIAMDDLKGLRISGENESDVDDALWKLSRIEKPLSRLQNPVVSNVTADQAQEDTGYRIQTYASLNPVALRRILADPSLGQNAGLGQMFVTTFYSFNEDFQKYTPPKNLVDPPLCSSENGKSRIWSDFSFQEVGKGDRFLALESIMENNPTESQLLPSGVTANHPYLSPEKVKQVKEWVVDGSNMEVTDTAQQPEDLAPPLPESPSKRLSSGPDGKKAPGIKVRRPVQAAQVNAVQPTKSLSPEVAPSGPQVEADGVANTPRKRWKMKYELNPSNFPEAQTSGTKDEKAVSYHKPLIDEPAISKNQKLECTAHTPIKFDSTNYGLNKSSTRTAKPSQNNSKAEKPGWSAQMTRGKPSGGRNELIEVLMPVDAAHIKRPPIQFNSPALVPAPPVSGSGPQIPSDASRDRSMVPIGARFSDLAGLNIAGTANFEGSTTSGSVQDGSSSKESFPHQAARLQNLNLAYNHLASAGSKNFVKPCKRRGGASRLLEKQVIEDIERAQKPEMEQSFNEAKSRQYHHTMNQKTAKPGPKGKTKAAMLAKRQATLEDAWGAAKQKKPLGNPQGQNASSGGNSRILSTAERDQKTKPQKKQGASVGEDIRRLFAELEPTLEAAEAFPGILTFEIQFGLVIIPLMPKTCNDNLISPTEWSKIFQPRSGMIAPTTKFISRLTACGSEVDHIVDLKTSKAEGKFRMFDQEYTEYKINYEFHCRTKANELLIIAIDEQGGYTIQNPKSVLGAVNMHFPRKIWDARAAIGCAAQYRPGSHPDLEEVAKYIADRLWIPAEKNIRIHTSLPKGSKISIEKVFMKRWTRHRYLRPGEALGRDNQTGESQNIFLQVLEVQDLFIGIGAQESSDNQHVRARYTKTEEMIQRGKVWYELSLVSLAIETILKTNARLEVGERTEDWRSADLFGDTAAFLTGQSAKFPGTPVAAAIGAGGIPELFQVAKAVVDKMNGVGACNRGPMGSETLRAVTNNAQGNKGWDFEELESVKEVESVIARIEHDPFDTEVITLEQDEKDFW